MATQTVKLKEVQITKGRDYVRGHVDKKNLADLMIVAKDPKHTGYPFADPVILRKLPKATKNGKLYTVLDGVHRTTVLFMLRKPTVEADVRTLSDKDAAVLQFTSNLSHGIRLNRKARNSWVKHMRFDLGMKLAEIAKEVGMTETSVSRMARDKQTKDGPRKKMERKAPATNGKPAAPTPAPKPAPWTPGDFFQRVKAVAQEVTEHPEAIRVYARQHSKDIIRMMEPISDVLNAALAIEATGKAG